MEVRFSLTSLAIWYRLRGAPGSVLVALHKTFPEFTFEALARDPKSLDAFLGAGIPVTIVHGSFVDLELISERAAEADVVVNAGDSHNVPLHKAILRGLKKRFDKGKGVSKFIHTSGTPVFWDGMKEGKANPGGKVWTVSNPCACFVSVNKLPHFSMTRRT